MSDQTELAFVKNLVKTIAVHPVAFDDDYQAPPHLALRRVPILSVRSFPRNQISGVSTPRADSSTTRARTQGSVVDVGR